MDKRFVIFVTLAMAILLLNAYLSDWLFPPAPPEDQPRQQVAVEPDQRPVQAVPEDDPAGEDPAEPPLVEEPAPALADQPPQWLTLGSADPASPYRMLVLLNNESAVVDQIDLNSSRFHDLDADETGGYLGPLAETDAPAGQGAVVNVVGPGTAAAGAKFPDGAVGLKPHDVVTSLDGQSVTRAEDLQAALRATAPGQTIRLGISRQHEPLGEAQAILAHRPLRVVSRERNEEGGLDPASLRLTLRQIGDEKVGANGAELKGVHLIGGHWKVERADQSSAEFSMLLPDRRLRVVKRFRLGKDGPPPAADAASTLPPSPNYHLDLDIEIYNLRTAGPVNVAYELDGPTGLPTEGWWYASKISPEWFESLGSRDVAYQFDGRSTAFFGCLDIANDEIEDKRLDMPLVHMGVDAQYVSAILIPQKMEAADVWFDDVEPVAVGPISSDKARRKKTNTSCRLVSKTTALKPAENGRPSLAHTYRFFAGPKQPDVLAWYQLDGLVYYGWKIWGFFSTLLVQILHFFYGLVGNYGLAIVMLTVLVRSCMFPISLKQSLNAQKMQELQPEIKKINEKYKGNMEQRNKATQELFKKNKYNPFGGCLLMFLQLPIFIGLYRGLMIDVELRQASLLPGLDWCSNLAAPDRLFRWDGYLPGFLASETGWLGPYFNLLPVITVALFLWQQKMFLPPPTDEQSAMQQKMMKYMTVFMAVMFFKVAGGLCIYFIASSLWGIAERKLLPKPAKPSETGQPAQPPAGGMLASLRNTLSGNGKQNGAADKQNAASAKRKKQRKNK